MSAGVREVMLISSVRVVFVLFVCASLASVSSITRTYLVSINVFKAVWVFYLASPLCSIRWVWCAASKQCCCQDILSYTVID